MNGSYATPLITARSSHRVAGTAPTNTAYVEIYVGVDGEAERLVGTAYPSPPGSFELLLDDVTARIPAQARVTALATDLNGNSSPASGWCAEGCVHAAGSNSCFDGDFCTQDSCGAGGCSWGNANGGLACDDGDDCTTASTCQSGACVGATFANPGTACLDDDPCSEASTCKADHSCSGPADHVCDDGDPCTREVSECDPVDGCPTEPRPIGYVCEDDSLCTPHGACDAFGACALPNTYLPVTCPQDTQCNVCQCEPNAGCVCEGVCGDGKCGPDDFVANNGGPCPECLDLQGDFDNDSDGFPNIWEQEGANVDVDCDGSFEYGPLGLEPNPFVDGQIDVFLEIDYMAGSESHEHFPYRVEVLQERFADEHNINLHVDISDEIPEVDRLVTSPKRTPLSEPGEWVHLRDIKRAHFDARDRRGMYHYLVIGHELDSRQGSKSGFGESLGDDAVVCRDTADAIDAALASMLHEIGHNFGLGHGGQAGGNFEVNLISVMNYGYSVLQIDGPAPTFGVDYSWNELLPMDDVAGVYEICPMWCDTDPTEGPLYWAEWYCPPGASPEKQSGPPHADAASLDFDDLYMDLNCDGAFDAGTVVTHRLHPKNKGGQHVGADEWARLEFDFHRHAFADELFNAEEGPTNAELAETRDLYAPRWPAASLYPGGTVRKIPRVGDAHRVPVVIEGDEDLDVTALPDAAFYGAPVVSRTEADLDGDGDLDLWLEYRAVDLDDLSTAATQATFYSWLPSSQEVFARWTVERGLDPADADNDGLHDAVDACDTTPPNATRGPDGCPWP